MSATTPNIGLYKPGGGSSGTITPDEVVDIDRLNGNSDIIDAEIGDLNTFQAAQLGRNQQFVGTAANLGSAPSPKDGDTYQETDGAKRLWRHDGSNWVAGNGTIRPTTIAGTGAAQAADGSVTLTATSGAVHLNGIFSDKFSVYQIILDGVFGINDGATLQLRAGTTTDSGANQYKYGIVYSGGANLEGQGTGVPLSNGGTRYKHDIIDIVNPMKATVRTTFSWQEAGMYDAATSARVSLGAAVHGTAGAYESLTITFPTSFTGTIRVIGKV